MRSTFRATCARLALAAAILAAAILAAPARADGGTTVYLPVVAAPGAGPTPTPRPTGGLPAALVGTWYSGQLLNLSYYNRSTGVWGSAGGLGHMYVFAADGRYTLVSHLELGGGSTCVSSVDKYHSGTARVDGGRLLLTPAYARTRTVTCGSVTSDTEGPYQTAAVPWRLGEDAQRHTRLRLTEPQGETEYYKDGLGPQLLGAWFSGDLGAVELYDEGADAWAEPTGASGEWFELGPGGRYRHGRVDAGFGDDPCRSITMTYESGALSGSGAQITLTPALALRRTVSLCDPGTAIDEPVASGGAERWSWGFGGDGATLSLIRVSAGFRQVLLTAVE